METCVGEYGSHRACETLQIDVALFPPVFSKQLKSCVPRRWAAAVFMRSMSTGNRSLYENFSQNGSLFICTK